MKRTTGRVVRPLVAASAVLALAGALTREARANFYAYAVQQTSGYAFAGATVGALVPLSSTSAAQVGTPSGSEAHTGGFDSGQSYVGTARPAENTFTALGQVNPDYARGDALVTSAPAAFTTNNVAEAFMIGPGNSAGQGSWAVSAPITVAAASALTLTFNYTNRLTLLNTSSPAPGTVAADYSYTFTIQNAAGAVVFTSSPVAVNNNLSLGAPGSIDLPGSGTIVITSGTLAVGSYTATISGSEHSFINSVPEPASVAMFATGVGVLGAWAIRNRKRLAPDRA